MFQTFEPVECSARSEQERCSGTTQAGGAFLQVSTGSVLKQLSLTMDISSMDREMLTSFLTQGQGESSGYVPQSGQITGITVYYHGAYFLVRTLHKHISIK